MTEGSERSMEAWGPAGTPLRGWRAFAVAIGALAWHLLTLQWLRAPRWKDKAEARAELARLLSEHASFSYEYWVDKIDRMKRVEFTTARGTWYQASVEPFWDDKSGGVIRVLVSVDDGGVGAFHPLSDCILVEPGDRAPRPTAGAVGA